MTRLVLYGRAGCHLCDDMLDDLESLCRGRRVTVEHIDVDTSAVLKARYGAEVPVLTDGEREICRHRLDRVAVMAALGPDTENP